MKTSLLPTCVSLLALLTSACSQVTSDHVNSSQIYTRYTIQTQDGISKIDVRSDFQVGAGFAGTVVKLQSPSRVLANGTEMALSENSWTKQIDYRTQVPCRSAKCQDDQVEVEYITTDGRSYRNWFQPVGEFSFVAPLTGSQKDGFQVTWNTLSPIGPDETLYAEAKAAGSTLQVSSLPEQTHPSKTSGYIVFDKSLWQHNPTQDLLVRVCRVRRPAKIQAPEVGGSATISHCNGFQAVKLLPALQ